MSKTNSGVFTQEPGLSKGRHIYTVSEITRDIKLILENTFSQVWVEGEISGISRISTGTVFFSLKDNNSLLKCVIFYSAAKDIKFKIQDGMKCLCCGRVGVYEKDGRYQLYVEQIEPKGIGSLQLALEQLKQKLEKEGLFSVAHKKPLPYLPSRVGIVTSLSGAALKDILKVLDRRFKDLEAIIYPVRVQGEGAKEEIAQAIGDFNRLNNIDVMIVGRGGGSIEDLWAFNKEIVARAIYNSRIPIISAVGHERDWTVADLVADVRAPTPSVAAELVIPSQEDLMGELEGLFEGLGRAFAGMVSNSREALDNLAHRLELDMAHAWELNLSRFQSSAKKLTLLDPTLVIRQHRIKIADLARQIHLRLLHFLQLRQAELNTAAEKLTSLSPLGILGRGYSLTFKIPEGRIIRDLRLIKPGDILKTRLHKGIVLSRVTEVNKDA